MSHVNAKSMDEKLDKCDRVVKGEIMNKKDLSSLYMDVCKHNNTLVRLQHISKSTSNSYVYTNLGGKATLVFVFVCVSRLGGETTLNMIFSVICHLMSLR